MSKSKVKKAAVRESIAFKFKWRYRMSAFEKVAHKTLQHFNKSDRLMDNVFLRWPIVKGGPFRFRLVGVSIGQTMKYPVIDTTV